MRTILALFAAMPIACGGSAQAGPQSVFFEFVYVAGSKVATVLVEKKADVGVAIVGSALYDVIKSHVYGEPKHAAPEQKSKPDQAELNGCRRLDDGAIRCADSLYLHNWMKAQPVSPAITPIDKQTLPYQPVGRYEQYKETPTPADKATARPTDWSPSGETEAQRIMIDKAARLSYTGSFSRQITAPEHHDPGSGYLDRLSAEKKPAPQDTLDPETQKLVSSWVRQNLLK